MRIFLFEHRMSAIGQKRTCANRADRVVYSQSWPIAIVATSQVKSAPVAVSTWSTAAHFARKARMARGIRAMQRINPARGRNPRIVGLACVVAPETPANVPNNAAPTSPGDPATSRCPLAAATMRNGTGNTSASNPSAPSDTEKDTYDQSMCVSSSFSATNRLIGCAGYRRADCSASHPRVSALGRKRPPIRQVSFPAAGN